MNERCHRTALESSEKGFCILHEDWSHKNEEETQKEFHSEIEKGITNFEGCILPGIDLSERKIQNVVGISFNRAIIKGDINFEGSEIGGFADFCEVKIEGSAKFKNAIIHGDLVFTGARIQDVVGISFNRATIKGDINFEGSEIGGFAGFREVKIGGNAWFRNAIIHGDLVFTSATIKGIIWFERTTVDGWTSFEGATMQSITIYPSVNFASLSFKYAKIGYIISEEAACRMAKITQERAGDRVLADYHFYREMVAKRKQKYKTFSLKPILKLMRKLELEKWIRKYKEIFEKPRRIYCGFLELPIQYVFGYGVYPWRVIATWLITVFSLAFVYYIGNGIIIEENLLLWERILLSIYFSIVIAATPGFGGYIPVPGFYQGLASFEAIFGTLMWAAFIATFARKYMR